MIFFFCILGEMVTNQFEMFNDELSQCNWYVLPFELQKIMIIVIVNAQRETVIRGFGNILCTRQTFKKVERVFFYLENPFYLSLLYIFADFPLFRYFCSIPITDNQFKFLIFHDSASNQWIKCTGSDYFFE